MPQSAISNKGDIPHEEIDVVVLNLESAVKCGLQHEWLEWYTCGIQQGMSPAAAAWEAAYEWDL